MRRALLTAILLLASVSGMAQPNRGARVGAPESWLEDCRNVRQDGPTIIFVNGINVSHANAAAACDDLASLLETRAGGIPGNVKLLYNRSADDAWKECEDAARLARRRETNEGSQDVWKFAVAPTGLGKRTLGTSQPVLIPEPALRAGCSQSPDLVEAAGQYSSILHQFADEPIVDAIRLRESVRSELSEGRRVIVVAHSQGNLLLLEALFHPAAGMSRDLRMRVGWIALASPWLEASPDLGLFASVLLEGDPIGVLRNQTSLTTSASWEGVLSARQHYFETYLRTPESRASILAALGRGFAGESGDRIALGGDDKREQRRLEILGGDVVSALDGKRIESRVAVRLLEMEPNGTSREVERAETSSGVFRFALPRRGTFLLTAEANGYTSSQVSLEASGAAAVFIKRIVLSPSAREDELRVVLTWSGIPRDLDLHLYADESTASPIHVFYRQRGMCAPSSGACLDVDDTDGYGPETITLRPAQFRDARIAVNNYSNGKDVGNPNDEWLGRSEARIDVYWRGARVRRFEVPRTAGTYWNVLSITGAAEVSEIGQLSGQRP